MLLPPTVTAPWVEDFWSAMAAAGLPPSAGLASSSARTGRLTRPANKKPSSLALCMRSLLKKFVLEVKPRGLPVVGIRLVRQGLGSKLGGGLSAWVHLRFEREKQGGAIMTGYVAPVLAAQGTLQRPQQVEVD